MVWRRLSGGTPRVLGSSERVVLGYLLHILEQEEAKDKEGQLSVFFFLVRLFYFSSTWDHYLWETTVLSNGVCE